MLLVAVATSDAVVDIVSSMLTGLYADAGAPVSDVGTA